MKRYSLLFSQRPNHGRLNESAPVPPIRRARTSRKLHAPIALLAASLLIGAMPPTTAVLGHAMDPALLHQVARHWPSAPGFTQGSYQRLVAGDFDNDGTVDVAVRRGNRAYVAHTPEVMGSFSEVGGLAGITDIDVLRSPAGNADRIIAAHGAISIAGFNDSTGTFAWSPTGVTQWGSVHSIDATVFGPVHIVLGRESTNTVRIGVLSGTALQQRGLITTSSDVLDTTIANVVGDALPEVVVLCEDGLRYYTIVGQFIGDTLLSTTSDRGAIATVHGPSTQPDRIVWATPGASNWVLRLDNGPDSIHSTSQLALGNGIPSDFTLLGISVGHVNHDQREDVLITIADAAEGPTFAAVVRQKNDGTGFDRAYLLPLPDAATTNTAPGILHDWNHSGHADAGFVRHGSTGQGNLQIHMKLDAEVDRIDSQLGTSSQAQGLGVSGIELLGAQIVRSGQDDDKLELRLLVPSAMRVSLNNDHIVAAVFEQWVPSSQSHQNPPPITAAARETVVAQLPANGELISVTVDLVNNHQIQRHYYIVLRMISGANTPYNGNQISETMLFGVAHGLPDTNHPAEALNYFIRPHSGLPMDLAILESEFDIHSAAGTGQNKKVGGVRSRDVEPPFPVQDPPQSPNLTHTTAGTWS